VANGGSPVLIVASADTSIAAPGSVGIRAVGGAKLGNFSASAVALNTPTLSFTDFTTTTSTTDGQLSLNWIDAAGDFVTNNAAAPGDAVALDSGTNLALLNTKVTAATLQVKAAVGGLKKAGAAAGLVAAWSGPGNTNLYWGRIANVGGKYFAQIVKSVNGSLKVLASQKIVSSSLNATGACQLEFDVTSTPGVSAALTLLVNGGSGAGGTTVTFTDSSTTALTTGGNAGISGTTGTSFSDFSV
jgi:hypothetical protein